MCSISVSRKISKINPFFYEFYDQAIPVWSFFYNRILFTA